MKRLICSLVVAMAAATSIWAGPVDEAKAKALAKRYINNPVRANARTKPRRCTCLSARRVKALSSWLPTTEWAAYWVTATRAGWTPTPCPMD